MEMLILLIMFFSLSHSIIGCADCQQSQQIYKQIERKHATVTALLWKYGLIVPVTIAFSASALFPISHAIFGYPPPTLWILPMQIQ